MPRHDAGEQALTPRGAVGDGIGPAIDTGIDTGIGTGGIGRIDWVDETGSTNADLLDWVRGSSIWPIAPRLLAARQQTAGRGRRGKTWHSGRGESLTFSLAWPLARTDFAGLSLAVGAALADALDEAQAPATHDATRTRGPGCSTGPGIGLKWPNDLWLTDAASRNGRKLAGVLIETLPHGDGHVAVIGVGINIGAMQLPLTDGSTGLAWLREIEAEATPSRVLERLAPALCRALRLFEREGFAAFAASFAARDVLRDRAVRCSPGRGGDTFGTAAGISPTGELLLRTADGGLTRIASGDVSIRLDEGADSQAATPAAFVATEQPC